MLLKLDFANYFSNFVSRMLFIGLENCNAPGVFIGINTVIYNAITQNNWFVKGLHKYDIYFFHNKKAHVN